MILAAGRGERLKPITDNIPKALCSIRSTPLIEYHITKLAHAGFERIVINHAYLGGKIRLQLGNGTRWGVEIIYSPEPPGGLETCGGIVNALSLLGQTSFACINADIYTDYNFANLTSTNLAHLVLVQKPAYFAHADFDLSSTNLVENDNRRYTFAGIACYHPQLFSQIKLSRHSLTPLLRQLAHNHQVSAELYLGKWIDIGTPAQLLLAQHM